MPGIVSPKKVCVHVRRVARHPTIRRAMRSGSMVRKNFVRTALISIVPSGLDDVIVHHKAMDAAEALYVTLDSMTISTMSAVATILLAAAKL
jgi:hypothetical protein